VINQVKLQQIVEGPYFLIIIEEILLIDKFMRISSMKILIQKLLIIMMQHIQYLIIKNQIIYCSLTMLIYLKKINYLRIYQMIYVK
jgi:hypothetical protein